MTTIKDSYIDEEYVVRVEADRAHADYVALEVLGPGGDSIALLSPGKADALARAILKEVGVCIRIKSRGHIRA